MRPDGFGALFGNAVGHQVQGRFAEALTSYESVVRLYPRVPEVYCNMAIVLQSLNRFDEAVACYDRAVLLQPDNADTHYNRGVALGFLNRLEDAAQSYGEAIRLKPDHVHALSNKGVVLSRLGRVAEALECFDRVVQLRSDDAEAQYNKANSLRELGRPEESLRCFDCVIALRPGYAEAYSDRAIVLSELDRHGDALQSAKRAIELKPDLAEAYHCKGNALRGLHRPEEALLSYDEAIAIRPALAHAYAGKGAALNDLDRLIESLHCFDRAIALKPDFPEAHNGRANILVSLKRPKEALLGFENAIALNSGYAEAIQNKASNLLLMGEWGAGWPLYEWRKRKAKPVGLWRCPQPEWNGNEDLDGKTLLLHAEQGLGDTFQFCRYARLARDRGAKVILAVQDQLMRLCTSLDPEIEIVPLSQPHRVFDYHAALMSMPLAFGTTLINCPNDVPYLRAEPEMVAKWRKRIAGRGLRIGICWQGNKQADVDVGRSFSVHHLEAIAQLPNVRLISLQKKDGVEQLHDLPSDMKVETLGEECDTGPDAFVDTAAVMECLDLIIASDTAIAHLAGALGRPVWVALKCVPDWRWLLDRADSPWYPTMRLFRQSAPGDWSSVFTAMEAQLIEKMSLKRNQGASS